MVEESKTTLFYILALAGLIISSVLFTGRIEPLAEDLSPAPTPPTFAKAETALNLPEADQKVCSITTQKTAFYRIDPGRLVDYRLVISGAVYASDFTTPVPHVLIEIWQVPESHSGFPGAPHYLFHAWARTDAAGHYKATILQPAPGNIPPLYYRVRYQNRCPLGLQLFLVDDEAGLTNSSLTSALAKLGLAQGEPAGPLLQDSVDIVLPVPSPHLDPPSPEASGSAAGMPPNKECELESSHNAGDTNLEAERNRPEQEFMKQVDLKVLREG